MTFNELCHRLGVAPPVLDEWARNGVFGPRLKESRDGGWHKHISKETAQRAVIMKTLVDAGLRARLAAEAAMTHSVNDDSILVIRDENGVSIAINRAEIDLP